MRPRELGEYRGQVGRCEVFRHAQANAARNVRFEQFRHGSVVEVEEFTGCAEQPLAIRRQSQRTRGTLENRSSQLLLEPLDLKADSRLGSAQLLACAGEAAGIGNRHEAAQQIDVEIPCRHADHLREAFPLSMVGIS